MDPKRKNLFLLVAAFVAGVAVTVVVVVSNGQGTLLKGAFVRGGFGAMSPTPITPMTPPIPTPPPGPMTVDAKLDLILAKLDNLSIGMATSFTAVNARFTAVFNNLSQFRQEIWPRFTELNNKLDGVSWNVANMHSFLPGLFTAVQNKLDLLLAK